MVIAELVQPGDKLLSFSESDRRAAEALIGMAVDQVSDAAIALNLFYDTYQQPNEAFEERRAELLEGMRRPSSPVDLLSQMTETPAERDERMFVEDVMRKHARWQEKPPADYRSGLHFMAARAFVYALDNLQKAIEELPRLADCPEAVEDIIAVLDAALPLLRKVRNSLHHPEQRVQGFKQGRVRIDLQAIDNEVAKAPAASILFAGQVLSDNHLGLTLEDGHYGYVEVSIETLEVARSTVQTLLDACEWSGVKAHYPTR